MSGAKVQIARAFDRIRYQHPAEIDHEQGKESERYCPHSPYPGMQRRFYDCDDREVAIGGLAGPGKTDVQLQKALKYVHVPGFACLILRRSLTDQSLGADAPMSRLHRWSAGTKARWNEQNKTYTFPGGSTVTFGYMDHANDHLRYKSAVFQLIVWMELTEHPTPDQYEYMMTRLRRLEGMEVPLQVTADFNPDGPGSDWIKKRFLPPEKSADRERLSNYADLPYDPAEPRKTRRVLSWSQDVEVTDPYTGDVEEIRRTFIPGYREDNPSQDWVSYGLSLGQSGFVSAAQLGRGDWEISPEGKYFKKSDFTADKFYDELPEGLQERFTGWDTGGSKQGDFWNRSCIALWGRTVYLDDWELFKADIPEGAAAIKLHALCGVPYSVLASALEECGRDIRAAVDMVLEQWEEDTDWRHVFIESSQYSHGIWQDVKLDRQMDSVVVERVKMAGRTKADFWQLWRNKFFVGEFKLRRAPWNEEFIKCCVKVRNDKVLDAGFDDGLDGPSVAVHGAYKRFGRREVAKSTLGRWLGGESAGEEDVERIEDDED